MSLQPIPSTDNTDGSETTRFWLPQVMMLTALFFSNFLARILLSP